MSNQYRLVALGNSELLAGLSALVRQSNELTAQLLAHLVELEERLLHLELGFSSLFGYCVEALAMSEGAAGRRVAAARVCRRFPEVFERVARGDLHLCALCALAPHLTAENARELFDACRRKPRRQIEELLAARFPRPDVREQIRRLPERVPMRATRPSAVVEKTLPALRADDASAPASPTIAVDSGPHPTRLPDPRRARELEPLSADRFGVHFTADAELRELIQRARAVASHRLPNGDLASLLKLAVKSFVKQEEKRRFGLGAQPRQAKRASAVDPNPENATEHRTPLGEVASTATAGEAEIASRPTPPSAKRGRHVSVKVRREIHGRDGGRCSFVSADGRRCTAKAFLEFDHVEPFARLGTAEAENIRLLCRAHNLLHARHCFGALHLAAKIVATRRTKPDYSSGRR